MPGRSLFSDRNIFRDLKRFDLSCFCAEPSASDDVGWEDRPFQGLLPSPFEDILPVEFEMDFGNGPLAGGMHRRFLFPEQKTVVTVRTEGDDIMPVANGREAITAEERFWNITDKSRKVELDNLGVTGEIDHHQNGFLLILPQEGEDLGVIGKKKLDAPSPEGFIVLAGRDKSLHVPEERGVVPLLVFDVDRFVVILRIDNRRKIKPVGVCSREA